MRPTNEISDPVWQDIWDRDEHIADITARLAQAEAALREIDRLQRAEMYERCPDCDYPDKCSRESGCCITERKGTSVQQVVWRIIGREAAKAGGP